MLDGILLVDKPPGITSFKVVEEIRQKFFRGKVGHLGTLDPLATGLLPICLGEATKIAQFMLIKDKEYEGTFLLGITTDTGDREGKVIKEQKDFKVKEEQIRTAFKKFTGTYLQTPPMYSAIKHEGKRLYQLAREGKEVERKKRKVTIYSLEMVSFSPPEIGFKVVCSKGTYIRSLVNDIGEDLGGGATLKDLRRTSVGDFSIEDAPSLKELLEKKSIDDYLVDMKTALKEFPTLTVKSYFARLLSEGHPVPKAAIARRDFKLKKGLIIKVLCEDGGLCSIAKCRIEEEEFANLAPYHPVFRHIRVFIKPL